MAVVPKQERFNMSGKIVFLNPEMHLTFLQFVPAYLSLSLFPLYPPVRKQYENIYNTYIKNIIHKLIQSNANYTLYLVLVILPLQ